MGDKENLFTSYSHGKRSEEGRGFFEGKVSKNNQKKEMLYGQK